MSRRPNNQPGERARRTMIKAFTFAGAILGVGAYGLARTVVLFAGELGWIDRLPELGAAYWWLAGGALAGFLGAWVLVRARGRGD